MLMPSSIIRKIDAEMFMRSYLMNWFVIHQEWRMERFICRNLSCQTPYTYIHTGYPLYNTMVWDHHLWNIIAPDKAPIPSNTIALLVLPKHLNNQHKKVHSPQPLYNTIAVIQSKNSVSYTNVLFPNNNV